MVNRARADPQADLAGCPNCADAGCYVGGRAPLEWYYDHARAAYVNIDGTCSTMSIERGSATNGTYLANVNVTSGCHDYYFIIVDTGGANSTYPTTGSFGAECASDWSMTRPAEGPGARTCPRAATG